MAMGLLGMLLPAELMSCSVRRRGEGKGGGTACRLGGGAGGEGCTPATACTTCLVAKVVDRYSLTCCRWDWRMW